MDPLCSASIGSAAVEIVQDPALAEVGVASEERIAGQCGQPAIQDSCDEQPQKALVSKSRRVGDQCDKCLPNTQIR